MDIKQKVIYRNLDVDEEFEDFVERVTIETNQFLNEEEKHELIGILYPDQYRSVIVYR